VGGNDVDGVINIEDLHRLAKRRIPKILFDFIEGGVEDEIGIAQNENAFRNIKLVPRYGANTDKVDLSTTVFGKTYSSPLGIAPTGGAALFRRGADRMLAEAARDADVPVILSGNGTGSPEEHGSVAPEHGWFQLYPARDMKISEDILRRVRDAGMSTLVVTMDVPKSSKRERNARNGFGRPLRLSLTSKIEAATHPQWMSDYLRYGLPTWGTWAPYAGPNATPDQVADKMSEQTPIAVTWGHIEAFRKIWKGNLVLKGIMHPDDARRALSLGVDGLMVSNHGGRQLDRSPSPIEVLPALNAAVGDKMTLMLDSGARRGSDVITALCLGAKFVFCGRPTLYGAVAGGRDGARKALEIFKQEMTLNMAHLAAPDIKSLGPHLLMWDTLEDLQRNQRT
jgi:L-lactate dehydrogenase (cytochrome)/(S)-mandelate dehydrogenase